MKNLPATFLFLFFSTAACGQIAEKQGEHTADGEIARSEEAFKLSEYLSSLLLGPEEQEIPKGVSGVFSVPVPKPLPWGADFEDIFSDIELRHFDEAAKKIEAVIKRTDDAFDGLPLAVRQRSMAIRLRGIVALLSAGDYVRALHDAETAADTLPDPRLLEGLINVYRVNGENGKAIPGLSLPQERYWHWVDSGRRLWNLSAVDEWVKRGGFSDQDEKIYWESVQAFLSYKRTVEPGNISLDPPRAENLDPIVEKYGEAIAARAIARYGLTGGAFASTLDGLPGRDVRTAMVTEGLLTTAYQLSPFQIEDAAATGEMPVETIADTFAEWRQAAAEYPAMAFLVSTAPTGGDRQKIQTTRAAMIAEVRPGDAVFLRCGPLSHVAVVYVIDKIRGRIELIDGFYQFFRPTHNECVSQYSFVDQGLGRFSTRVEFDEFGAMLQALFTIRDKADAH